MKQPKSILITGASSGIGQMLAQKYARDGITLFLSGRNQERLEAAADVARQKGADVHSQIIDVSDRAAMEAWIHQADEIAPLELVIANAGVGLGGGSMSKADIAEKTFAVNVTGVFNTVHPAIDVMRPREKGQIAITASIAGFVGMPSSPAYCASKAAARSYGDALRGVTARYGIEVTVICPGFVDTPLTKGNKFKMPLLMGVERAADIIIRGLKRNKARIVFPLRSYWSVRFLHALPAALVSQMTRRAPAK